MKHFIVEKITMKPKGIHGDTTHTEVNSIYVTNSKICALSFIKGVAFSHVGDARFNVSVLNNHYCYMLTTLFDSCFTIITEYSIYNKDEFEDWLDSAVEDSDNLFETEKDNEAISNICEIADGYYGFDDDIKDCIFIKI